MHTATNHCTILPNFTKLSRAALHIFSTPIDTTGGWWVRLSLPDAAKAPHHAGNNTDDADADEDDGDEGDSDDDDGDCDEDEVLNI